MISTFYCSFLLLKSLLEPLVNKAFDMIRHTVAEAEHGGTASHDDDSQGIPNRRRHEWRVLGEKVCLKAWKLAHGMGSWTRLTNNVCLKLNIFLIFFCRFSSKCHES